MKQDAEVESCKLFHVWDSNGAVAIGQAVVAPPGVVRSEDSGDEVVSAFARASKQSDDSVLLVSTTLSEGKSDDWLPEGMHRLLHFSLRLMSSNHRAKKRPGAASVKLIVRSPLHFAVSIAPGRLELTTGTVCTQLEDLEIPVRRFRTVALRGSAALGLRAIGSRAPPPVSESSTVLL